MAQAVAEGVIDGWSKLALVVESWEAQQEGLPPKEAAAAAREERMVPVATREMVAVAKATVEPAVVVMEQRQPQWWPSRQRCRGQSRPAVLTEPRWKL